MARNRIYDYNAASGYMELLAPYYNAIETTNVIFENEKIIAYADSLGHIEFFDMEQNSLGFVDVPVSKDPSEKGHTAQYGNARCLLEGNTICFELPVYGWRDYYPYCDGESDRWDRYIARWFRVTFDYIKQQISIEE